MRLNLSKMTEQETVELAAILVNEHGHAALDVAERRRAQFADKPDSDGFRLWSDIAEAVIRVLRVKEREKVTSS